MDSIVLQLVFALVQLLPRLIESISKSGQLSDEVKKAALDELERLLDETRRKVEAVTFRSV